MRICSFQGCDRKHVGRNLCGTHGRQDRLGKPLTPIKPYRQHGSGSVTAEGYRVRWINGQQRYEHRLVMEEKIGRSLRPEENVHHINGNRLDNRPENLELWNTSQPPGQRVEDKLAWAKQILASYAPSGSFNEEELW